MRDIKFKYIFKGLPFSSVNSDFHWHVKIFTLKQIEAGVVHLSNLERTLGELVSRLQFTGLTDKNGVEIYEGDIVEERRKNACWDSDKVFTLKVSFYRGMFVAGKSNALHGFSGVTYKVIGNIHENPELLNK